MCISVDAFFFSLRPRVCTCESVSRLPAASRSGDRPASGVARRSEPEEGRAAPPIRRAGREDEEEGVCGEEEEEGRGGRGEVEG